MDPITRISGFLEIKVEMEADLVVNAFNSGLLYRGFEKMLRGRPPLDVVYFTERVCGICSTAHAMASSLALEDALKIEVNLNDKHLRDILHGFEFIQNHLRHFYLFVVPDYVKFPDLRPITPQIGRDFRLTPEENMKIVKNYERAIILSRLAHEGLAILGGKAPHNHGVFPGGITVNIDAYKLEKISSIINEIKSFVIEGMLEDTYTIARYYGDYFYKGNTYGNFLSYGVFYVEPGVMIQERLLPLQRDKISENIRYAWYNRENDVDLNKEDAYTFIKAPRYEGLPMEVGPLARMKISGNYKGGNSAMDRVICRTLETLKILEYMDELVRKVELKPSSQRRHDVPSTAFGAGLVDTTRGALGHWLSIEDGVIKNYDIITPTVWNLSPRDEKNVPGTGEKALIGTVIADVKEPIELGRIIRSFDPCVSCATHVILGEEKWIQ